MKLSDYAKKYGITYKTAWNRFKAGKIKGAYKDETGHIVVPDEKELLIDKNKVAIYARVSSNENKSNLEKQAERLKEYAIAKGYQIVHIVKEAGSGVNDNRPKLLKLLQKDDWRTLIIEHKNRLTRFRFNYIKTLIEKEGRQTEVVNLAEDDKTELIENLIAMIYSFSARMYRLRRRKRKTEKIIQCLKQELENAD